MSKKRGGGRPPKPRARRMNSQINLRMKDDLVEMLTEKAGVLEKAHPEVDWTLGNVVRHMLYKAFQADKDDV